MSWRRLSPPTHTHTSTQTLRRRRTHEARGTPYEAEHSGPRQSRGAGARVCLSACVALGAPRRRWAWSEALRWAALGVAVGVGRQSLRSLRHCVWASRWSVGRSVGRSTVVAIREGLRGDGCDGCELLKFGQCRSFVWSHCTWTWLCIARGVCTRSHTRTHAHTRTHRIPPRLLSSPSSVTAAAAHSQAPTALSPAFRRRTLSRRSLHLYSHLSTRSSHSAHPHCTLRAPVRCLPSRAFLIAPPLARAGYCSPGQTRVKHASSVISHTRSPPGSDGPPSLFNVIIAPHRTA